MLNRLQKKHALNQLGYCGHRAGKKASLNKKLRFPSVVWVLPIGSNSMTARDSPKKNSG
jgi:hypothetical protein